MYGYGNSMFLATHGILARSGPTGPINTVAPAITGTAVDEYTLSCSTGTWTGTGSITYAYQWTRNGSNIGSATNSTYTLVTADVGQSILCVVTATDITGNASANSNIVTPISNAQYFINQAGITDATQQSAINTLVTDLKGYGIWTKMKALYPFVGGTAAQHKWNLKDPRDLDVAFRLVFNGGWTHSSTGALPNGTNGFTDTKLNPQNNIGSLNISFGIYIPNTHKAVSGHGIWDSLSRRTNLLQFSGYYSQITTNATQAYFNSNSNGFIQASRTSSSSNKLYRNGSLLNTNTSVETTQLATNGTFYFSFINGSGLNTDYGSNELRFAYISTGLTDTEAANFYTAVQAFQTTLARQV